MINSKELLLVVDENNSPIEPIPRDVAHIQGVWHRVADIVVVNPKYEILCHQRSMLKDNNPGKWDIAFGGHALPGMEMLDCAMVELQEESGLVANPKDMENIGLYKQSSNNGTNVTNNHFFYVYVYHWDGNMENLKLEESEVALVELVPVAKLKEQYASENSKWTRPPYMTELLNTLYERSRS